MRKAISTHATPRRRAGLDRHLSLTVLLLSLYLCVSAVQIYAQQTPPAPGEPRPVKIPQVVEKKLPNGLTVIVVQRKGSPLVAGRLLIGAGSTTDDIKTAGLTKMTFDMLAKGTTTRNATQIANDLEFLGADLSTTVGLDSSAISFDVTSDKVRQLFPIFADIALRPTFPQKELDLAKSQAIDELQANLQQPGFLANYVASVYSFNCCPMGGTPSSLRAMKREQLASFYKDMFQPDSATLILVGDIDSATALEMASMHFGTWRAPKAAPEDSTPTSSISMDTGAAVRQDASQPLLKRILVVDLPKSGQAAVVFAKDMQFAGRITWDEATKRGKISKTYFPGLVMNSVLGGGYSSRLNYEIRIKRGLSYGAGSGIRWRPYSSMFTTRIQTKNESAAEVAELTRDELERMATQPGTPAELAARKASLIGTFAQNTETDAGLLNAISDLNSDWLPADELTLYNSRVQAVTSADAEAFARNYLMGGDMIIAGDYSVFKDDLKKRFPDMPITVIAADKLDVSKDNLQQ